MSEQELTGRKHLNLTESAKYCGMKYAVFIRWFKTGRIPYMPTVEGSPRKRIFVDRLDAFLESIEEFPDTN